ncbi:hypothetical protein OIU84_025643 [Salix udensis]|uniref:Protein kinase domain-containing protein n=1 Tax=Salix udensis TaxID=889485 RepID=A0AAD6KKJ6_9ROSI|nr:hypothetical protein OIU84_025643 [Salix udensis]
MAALLRALHFVLALFISLKNLALAQDINQFFYNGFKGANLSLDGIARIHPNGLLELTNASKQQIGQAFFPFPFHFNTLSNNSRSLSFSTNFVFAMVPESPMRGGHGIAFTISPSTEFNGATATQYLGLFNSTTIGLSSNHLLAIELDAVRSPEFGDINDNHVGIDVNNLTSIQSAPASYFSEHGGNEILQLISGDPMQVWIDYDEMDKLLNVTLAPVSITKPQKPLLSTSIDLSLVLLDSMYVGFSSSTGSVSSHHYILGWSFNKSGKAQSLGISKLPSLPPGRNSSNKPDLRIVIPLITVSVFLIASLATVCIMRNKYEEVREDWEQQYGPQRGVGSALLYLHEEWQQVVLHRDVKASNVLLDGDFNGRLGDFGLAKFHDHGSTPQTTNVVGTVGYLAPEITRTGKATTSGDVFAFGTFMLEVACGRRPVESERSPEEVVLVDWKARPSMRQVVQFLDGDATLPGIPVNGAGIGLVPVSSEASRDHVLTIPVSSDDVSSYCLSDCESILSGR